MKIEILFEKNLQEKVLITENILKIVNLHKENVVFESFI